MKMHFTTRAGLSFTILTLTALIAVALVLPRIARAQQVSSPDPFSALNAALVAACRQNAGDFANYLTSSNAAAFRGLSQDDQTSLMERFVLVGSRGRPLLSSDVQNHPVLRCEGSESATRLAFGSAKIEDNFAEIPVTLEDGKSVAFGLIRDHGGWKLLSIGLLLIDIPQLERRWSAEALAAREQAAIENLHSLADAISAYHDAFGKLPESLTQLGPPAAGAGVSPAAAKLIPAELAAGSDGGYSFRYRVISPASGGEEQFEIAAVPAAYGKTGKRSFLLDEDGKLHAADKHGGVATPQDAILSTEGSISP